MSPASADVTLTSIAGEDVWQANRTLEVEELYIRTNAPNLGDATLAMLDGSRYAVLDSRIILANLAGSDNILDSRLAESLAALDLLESAILEVQYFGASTLRAPTNDGRENTPDRASLAVLDAISRAHFDGNGGSDSDRPTPQATGRAAR